MLKASIVFEETLLLITEGTEIQDIEWYLILAQEREDYESCLGLKCALLYAAKNSIQAIGDLILTSDGDYTEIINKLKDKYYELETD